MTAITAFERLESTGRYSDDMDHDNQEVVVTLGNVSLVIGTFAGEHLAHWSLPALSVSQNANAEMIIYPHDGAQDFVVIDDPVMQDAIRQLQSALHQRRKKPWGLRFALFGTTSLIVLGVGVFVVPKWMTHRAAAIPPQVRQVEISQAILEDLSIRTGPMCQSPEGDLALNSLIQRTFPNDPPTVYVLPSLTVPTVTLPGDVIVLSEQLVLNGDDPAVVAGHLLAARVAALTHDPMTEFVTSAGLGSALSILTTGKVRDMDIAKVAQTADAAQNVVPNTATLLTAFELADISAAAYASHLPLSPHRAELEKGDPFPNGSPFEILEDGLWISLQDICADQS